MPAARTYGVFLPGGKWGRTNSLAEAKKAVDKYGGQIRSMPSKGNNIAYDSHTFFAVSVAVPYTPKKIRMKIKKGRK